MKVAGSGQQDESWGCCDPRQPSGIASMSTMPAVQSAERAGIGIILALSPDSSLYVHTVCPGGSAENSLEPGDVLLKIGGEVRSVVCNLQLSFRLSRVEMIFTLEVLWKGQLHVVVQQISTSILDTE